MTTVARRSQPAITIRSSRATDLLRRLATGGRSQVDIIEEALERMASERRSVAQALSPREPLDFDWEPVRSTIAGSVPDFLD